MREVFLKYYIVLNWKAHESAEIPDISRGVEAVKSAEFSKGYAPFIGFSSFFTLIPRFFHFETNSSNKENSASIELL